MKDNDVAYFVEQLGLTKEEAEGSVEDGTLSQRIKDSQKDQTVYKTQADFDTFKTNHAAEVTKDYFEDMVDKAKKGDIPQELYAPIKGATLQQASRELGKRVGVETYNDLNDLVDQAIKTSANGKGDPELQDQLSELKKVNLKLVEEKENAVKNVEEKYMNESLTRDKLSLLSKVPHDFSNVKPDELEARSTQTKGVLRDVFDARNKLTYNDKGQLVVLKDGEVMKNQATYDPIPALDVMISLAKDIGQKLISPDSGGQGGKSSINTGFLFTDGESFAKYCKDNNILQTSKEGLKLWVDSGLKE